MWIERRGFGLPQKQKFLAAIEPWHGNQIVIYSPQHGVWRREVIDNSLEDGHTIVAADFDGDGRDGVVAGFRKGATSLFLYRSNDARQWTKQLVDAEERQAPPVSPLI